MVLLATVLASIALGMEDELRRPAASGGFDHDYTAPGAGNTDDRPYVKITHRVGRTVDGDNIVIRDESGNEITWQDVWTGGPEVKAGEYGHIHGFGSDATLNPICESGDTCYVVLQNDTGETLVVNEWMESRDTNLAPRSPSDADGDGFPDRC